MPKRAIRRHTTLKIEAKRANQFRPIRKRSFKREILAVINLNEQLLEAV